MRLDIESFNIQPHLHNRNIKMCQILWVAYFCEMSLQIIPFGYDQRTHSLYTKLWKWRLPVTTEFLLNVQFVFCIWCCLVLLELTKWVSLRWQIHLVPHVLLVLLDYWLPLKILSFEVTWHMTRSYVIGLAHVCGFLLANFGRLYNSWSYYFQFCSISVLSFKRRPLHYILLLMYLFIHIVFNFVVSLFQVSYIPSTTKWFYKQNTLKAPQKG